MGAQESKHNPPLQQGTARLEYDTQLTTAAPLSLFTKQSYVGGFQSFPDVLPERPSHKHSLLSRRKRKSSTKTPSLLNSPPIAFPPSPPLSLRSPEPMSTVCIQETGAYRPLQTDKSGKNFAVVSSEPISPKSTKFWRRTQQHSPFPSSPKRSRFPAGGPILRPKFSSAQNNVEKRVHRQETSTRRPDQLDETLRREIRRKPVGGRPSRSSSSVAVTRPITTREEIDRSLALRLQQEDHLLYLSDWENVCDNDSVYAHQLQAEENAYVTQQEHTDAQLALQLQEAEEAEQMRREAHRVNHRDCAVCGEAFPAPDFPALVNCAHLPQTCAACYQGWIEAELNSKSWNEIRCPGYDCRVILQHYEVQQYATLEVYQRFDALSARNALNDDPQFRWCRARNCQSGQIHVSGEEGNIFRCVACGFRICIIHDDTWHEGETCEEYDYRISGNKARDQQSQEKASAKAIADLTKKCPGKQCGWNIEKNEGCDHMTCSKCRHEFCWVCLAPYGPIRSKGNSAHDRNCKHHTSNIED